MNDDSWIEKQMDANVVLLRRVAKELTKRRAEEEGWNLLSRKINRYSKCLVFIAYFWKSRVQST